MKTITLGPTHRRDRLALAAMISFAVLIASAAEPASQATVNAAVAKAKSEKKKVLLHFTGTDWCSECHGLQTEVMKTRTFKDYAATNFVVVEVLLLAGQDSPLIERYGVIGWPTLVLLDADGREIDKVPGYRKGDGPELVIRDIESRRTKGQL